MKKKSVGVNAVLNTIKQCCAIIFPLITFPYISRVLGVENYGKVNFGNSIISYFSLIAALGITNYAIREGARLRSDKEKFQNFARQVFTINCITTLISYFILVILIISWEKLHSYWNLLLIQSLIICLTTIGADWVNSIYEDYLYITIRYILVQVAAVAAMFLLVKEPEDYILYAGITVFANAGANIANCIHIRRYVKLKLTRKFNFRKHIGPMLLLFSNSMSVMIYVNSDVTILGIAQSDTDVGIYSASVKIYNIMKQLLNAIIVVAIPRVSSLLGEDNKEEYNKLLSNIFHSIICITVPAITGIFMLSYEIIEIIGGSDYSQGYWALRILSIALFGAVFANFFNNAVLVPNKKEKYFLYATLTAAVANVLLNLVLIPYISYIGAALTTVLAEFIVLAFGFYHSRKLCDFSIRYKDLLSCAIGCAAIVFICAFVKHFIYNTIACLLICVLISVPVYALILLAFKNYMLVSAKEYFVKQILKK